MTRHDVTWIVCLCAVMLMGCEKKDSGGASNTAREAPDAAEPEQAAADAAEPEQAAADAAEPEESAAGGGTEAKPAKETKPGVVSAVQQPGLTGTFKGETFEDLYAVAYVESDFSITLAARSVPFDCGYKGDIYNAEGEMGVTLGLWKRIEPDGSLVMTRSAHIEPEAGDWKIVGEGAARTVKGELKEPMEWSFFEKKYTIVGPIEVPVCPPGDTPEDLVETETDLIMTVAGHAFPVKAATLEEEEDGSFEVVLASDPVRCGWHGTMSLALEFDAERTLKRVRLIHQNVNYSTDISDDEAKFSATLEVGEGGDATLTVSGALEMGVKERYTVEFTESTVPLTRCEG